MGRRMEVFGLLACPLPLGRLVACCWPESLTIESVIALWQSGFGSAWGTGRMGRDWSGSLGLRRLRSGERHVPQAPEVISIRPASVQLTRSIPRKHKQLLKEQLKFAGYRIGELYPRRTRRATAVNWLLAWLASHEQVLEEEGPLPPAARSAAQSSERSSRRSFPCVEV